MDGGRGKINLGEFLAEFLQWRRKGSVWFTAHRVGLTELRRRAAETPTSSSHPSDDQNKTSPESGTCCACPKTAQQLEIEQQERRYQTEFESFLLGSLYQRM